MNGDILSRLQEANSDQEREWLVLQFSLAGLEPAVHQGVQAAAIPHWFDAQFLSALSNGDWDIDTLGYKKLLSLSFVESFPERGYNIHERSRALLLNNLWKDDPSLYRKLSQRAAIYCSKQDQEVPAWRIERIYHLLIADPSEGIAELTNTCWEWRNPPNFAYDKMEALVRQACEHAEAGRLNERETGWTLFWEAHIDMIYYRYFPAKDKLLQIKTTLETDNYLFASTLQFLGDINRVLNEYPVAQDNYNKALIIYRQIDNRLGEENCIQSLGDIHYSLNDFMAARECYQQALKISRQIDDRLGEANCIQRLGGIHLALNELTDAREYFEGVLEIHRQIGNLLGEANSIQGLGDIFHSLNEYQPAKEHYQEALDIYRQIGNLPGVANCAQRLGDTYYILKEYPAAREHYHAALEIYHQLGSQLKEADCLLSMGDSYCLEEKWADAGQSYLKALSLYQESDASFNTALTLQRLGDLAQREDDIARARQNYQAALKIYNRTSPPLAQAVQAVLDELPEE